MIKSPKAVNKVFVVSLVQQFRHTWVTPSITKKTKKIRTLEEVPETGSPKYKVKIGKVKCNIVQALRLCRGRTTHKGSRGIDLLFLDHGTRRGEWSASRPGHFLPPGKTRYPLYKRLGRTKGRCGQVRKISLPPGFDRRTVQSLASR